MSFKKLIKMSQIKNRSVSDQNYLRFFCEILQSVLVNFYLKPRKKNFFQKLNFTFWQFAFAAKFQSVITSTYRKSMLLRSKFRMLLIILIDGVFFHSRERFMFTLF